MYSDSNIIRFPGTSLAGSAHSSTLAAPGTAVQARDGRLAPGEVWDALESGRLVMHYQPQYALDSGAMVAAEALVRLVGTDGTLIYPDRFIDMVEGSDLVVPLGRAVITRVCADLAACRARGTPLARVAVNVSARQISIDASLPQFVSETLAEHGLDAGDLEFELTERQLLDPAGNGFDTIHALAALGLRLSVDDFGMGYSSMAYLTDLPVSAFKLDRSLVARLEQGPAMQQVVRHLLALAADLELEVVAEGIENRAQEALLAAAGCTCGQGFGYARPMPMATLQAFAHCSHRRRELTLYAQG